LTSEDVGGTATSQFLVYQVAREALNNAMRHSHASNVVVAVTRSGADIHISIHDNGTGFRVDDVDRKEHFGLQLLAERVEIGGGKLRIRSSPGAGTTIAASVPADSPWQI
jgi:signal transduction histidine kinase